MATTALTLLGRDLVMRTLDRLADKLGGGGSAPSTIQQIADSWKSLTPPERQEIANHIAATVEVVIAAIPLAIGGTAAAMRERKARRAAKAQSAAKKSPAKKPSSSKKRR